MPSSLRLNIIEHQFVPTLDKFEHLKTVQLSNFRCFVQEFFTKMRIQALIQGNLDTNQATSIMTNLVETLKCSPIQDPTQLELRVKQVPLGANYLRCRSMNESDANTVTENYYQIGPISIRLNCLVDLLVLVAEEPAFDMLRSKEQLGYDVGCSLRDTNGILGYTISVVSQENKFTSEHVDERIEAFRTDLLNIVNNMSVADFEQFRATLIKLKLTDDNELSDVMTRNWAEVTTDEYLFDRHRKEVECLKTLTQKEFKEFYLEHFNDTRKLSVQVIGNAEVDAAAAEIAEPVSIFEQSFKPLTFVEIAGGQERGLLIRNVDEFRATLVTFPVSKTIVG